MIKKYLFIFFLFAFSMVASAQFTEYKEGDLKLETDFQGYFTNNEFKRHVSYGYTLGGIRLTPKLSYSFSNNLKFYFGFSGLKYWGTNYYPLYNYTLIPEWDQTNKRQKLLHILPYLRFEWRISEKMQFVMGNIDKEDRHLLNVALWNPELDFAMDYEEGLQLKYHSSHWQNEVWLNWQNFNYINDVDRESFLFGIAGKLNSGERKNIFLLNYAFMWQHHGGELDTLTSLPLDHWLNGSFGLAYERKFNNRFLEKIGLSLDWVFCKSLKNDTWFFKAGNGIFANLYARAGKYNLRFAYYYSEDMMSMYGSPFFSNIAQRNKNEYYLRNQLLNAHFSLSLYSLKQMNISLFTDLYYKLDKKTNLAKENNNLSISFGISMDCKTKHLIKNFENKH
ncbi:MAG: hypothetical protein Q4Q06_02650 [Bacteroidota bacterium]|nr:hypothetical protein [Bacteroidota bacterium]